MNILEQHYEKHGSNPVKIRDLAHDFSNKTEEEDILIATFRDMIKSGKSRSRFYAEKVRVDSEIRFRLTKESPSSK